jgi:uncharacterized membrane protein HdeD (DUF308 family)
VNQIEGLPGTLNQAVRYAGFGLVILGVVACVAPLMSGAAIAVIIGLVLLAAGGLAALFGWRAREAGKGNVPLVIGALAGISGLVLIVQPTAGLALVRLILIPYMLLSGASEIALAFKLSSGEGRTEAFAGAVVSIVVGLVLWFDWPISGARALGLLVGSKLISSGLVVMRVQRAIESAGEKIGRAREVAARRS